MDFHFQRRKEVRSNLKLLHLLPSIFFMEELIMSESTNSNKISAAKRRANDKWDRENMVTIACKLRKEDADAFREYARQNGKAVNTLLKSYVFRCIGKPESENIAENTLD